MRMTISTEWRAAQIPHDEPQQIVATGFDGGNEWRPASGVWEADDFGIDSDETVGSGERLFVNRRIYDALLARIERLEAALENLDANLTHFLKRNPQQVMLPETVEFVRDMSRAALAKEITDE